jgi:phosphoribosylglycinamide formyltransferase-1
MQQASVNNASKATATQRVAVLISGNGSNLQAIIDAPFRGQSYEVALVLSNRPQAYGLQRAEEAGIPHQAIDHTEFESRETFEQALIDVIEQYDVDYVILAGFMRILSPVLTQKYLGRMLNIHPSLLPKYRGLHTHRRALEAGDKTHGLSIHFVTEELDGGPVILQAQCPIEENDTEASLKAKVHELEHQAYPLAIDAVAKGIIRYNPASQQAEFQGKRLDAPLSMEALSHSATLHPDATP